MNGAGKTTTMKILTGEDLCTRGDATLGGFDIKTQQNKVRQLIGYCPQFDALIATLTAREHLMLFARIKGVSKERIREYVEQMLAKLTLADFADRQAGTFSGGMKRKLSLGIALIGNPRIIFLDEPTTGVDPESRRFVWTLISNTLRRSSPSVILTTHSMDECEALCSRIGIMVNGQLVCLGSAPRLKDVHGFGYQFDVVLDKESNPKHAFQALGHFLKQRFPEGVRCMEGGAVLNAPNEAFSQRMKFRLPKGKLPISAIFQDVEERRKDLQVKEYSISETTLEQIFIQFAKHQYSEDQQVSLAEGVGGLSFGGLSFQRQHSGGMPLGECVASQGALTMHGREIA
jgi:ABC-type multidrug transport system ATPase subunit